MTTNARKMLKLEPSHVSLVVLSIFFGLLLCIQARHHSHTKHKHSHSQTPSPISQPPAPPPDDDQNDNFNVTSYFDVTKFGAVGDGITDDTEAFKMAWDTACQSESEENVIYVPFGLYFMIQSTIFTGPCQGHLILKVSTNYTLYMPFGSCVL